MCYSGICKYEDHQGNCQIHNGQYPTDALCNIIDEETRDIFADELKRKALEEIDIENLFEEENYER